jgi:hypothetical protein
MPTTQTIRRLPPTKHADLRPEMQFWELETQQVAPLRLVDTSAGSYEENPPEAGLNTSTGQTNQNQEITYKKISADGNTFTLAGVGGNLPEGPLTLTAQWQSFKIKSNGTDWYKVG